MLTTPSMQIPIRPFDARIEYKFQFEVEGGAQVLKNRLVITNQSTGVKIYDITHDSFGYGHTIPPNTLINGETYLVKVQTGGLSVDAVTGVQKEIWSLFSDEEIVYCLSPARITIPKTIIDTDNQNRVNNEEVNFEASYEQDEGEQLQSYRFILYDDTKQQIKIFDEQFYAGTGSMEQLVAGLKHSELYYIQVKTESVKGLLVDSEMFWFRPFYTVPTLTAIITPENLKDKGAIKLSSNIVQIVGELIDNTGNVIPFTDIEYVDNDKLDLTRPDYKKLVYEKGFAIQGDGIKGIDKSDFTLKLWFENIPLNESFLRLYDSNGEINLVRRNFYDINDETVPPQSSIVAFKSLYDTNFMARFETDEFLYSEEKYYCLQLRHSKNLLDIKIEEVNEVIANVPRG